MLASNKLQNKNPNYVKSGILKQYIDDNKQRFEVIVLPQTLTQPALQLAHRRVRVIMEYLKPMLF